MLDGTTKSLGVLPCINSSLKGKLDLNCMILYDFTKNGSRKYIVTSQKRLKAYHVQRTIVGALHALSALKDTRTRHSTRIACANN